MKNINFAIKRFNKMHSEIDFNAPLGIERAKVVLKYGLNLMHMYKDSNNIHEVVSKVVSLNNILIYKR